MRLLHRDLISRTKPRRSANGSSTSSSRGPLKDTVIQRWRDPNTGVLCNIYLPVVVQHLPPLENGMVHYGANGTGTISCVQPKAQGLSGRGDAVLQRVAGRAHGADGIAHTFDVERLA